MSRPGVRVSSPALVDSRGQRRIAALALAAVLFAAAVSFVLHRDSDARSGASTPPRTANGSRPGTAGRRPSTTPAAPTTTTTPLPPAVDRPLALATTVTGAISPKSVVATGTGLVFAQNMMYRHTMTVYSDAGALVKTIPDGVDLAAFGYPGHAGISRGAPVEGAVSPDRKYFYVTNYSMYGENFGPEGSDECSGPGGLSPSYVYRVDLRTGAVTPVARLGHAGGEGEGIDATALPTGFLHVLCVDAKYVPVWFEHFRA